MEQEIRRYLGNVALVGREIRCFDVMDSTNTYLKKAAGEGAVDGTVVIANHQTAGRGRMERTFQSSAGKGLYLSLLLRPQLPPENLLSVPALAGVAACSAVEGVCGVRPKLKWPNDLVLGNRKLGGILAESGMDEQGNLYLVLGIGINLSQTTEDFAPDVAQLAVSLHMEIGKLVSREALAAALIGELDCMYTALKKGDLTAYLTAYRRDCVNLGETVQLIYSDGRRKRAQALDVDESFGLMVLTDTGEQQTIRSGEVSVRGLYGYIE